MPAFYVCRYVGEVTRVNPTLLRSLVDSGYIPVVATVATDGKGQALNINADTAAGEVRRSTGPWQKGCKQCMKDFQSGVGSISGFGSATT
jgi:hypothetical protein